MAHQEDAIVKKMKALEQKLQLKKVEKQGQILVNGPIPANFKEQFVQAVSQATGALKQNVKVTGTKSSKEGIVTVTFLSSPHVVTEVENEATDPDSKLATGPLHNFLVSKGGEDDDEP